MSVGVSMSAVVCVSDGISVDAIVSVIVTAGLRHGCVCVLV